MPTTMSVSATFPVTVTDAFDRVLPMDLRRLLPRRTLAIPPISEVRDQTGQWGTPGQSRTIVLADGATMRETLDHVERPSRFTYRIDDVTGVMRLLVGSAKGTWAFTAEGAGCRVTWTWVVEPTGAPAALAMPAFRWMWTRHAAKGFDALRELLTGPPRDA